VGRAPRVDHVARAPFEKDRRAEPAEGAGGGVLQFVSVGTALPGHEVRLVDDQGVDVAERAVGSLIFRGPSSTAGYYRKPEATAAITRPGGWLDSGDLAYRAEGEIFIAGRRKDLIIKAGRNLVRQEIEESRRRCGIRRGCVVAFGVSRPGRHESMVVVAETRARSAGTRAPGGRGHGQVAAALGLPPT
jgi:acyl-CoA synthetase (AMP-forming)/AMP-acid ligase II